MHGMVQQHEVKPPMADDSARPALRRVASRPAHRRWACFAVASGPLAITVVLVMVAAVLITLQLPKSYTATALVVVDSRDFRDPRASVGGRGNRRQRHAIDTEVQIARSSKVLRRAVVELDLVNRPDFQDRKSALDMVTALFGLTESGDTAPGTRRDFDALLATAQAQIVDRFAKSVNISRVGVTNVIEISATMSTPEGAALAANKLAEVYLAEQIEAKLSSNERAATFLRDRVASLAAGHRGRGDRNSTISSRPRSRNSARRRRGTS